MKAEITVLAGDGIGPEITEHALNIPMQLKRNMDMNSHCMMHCLAELQLMKQAIHIH